MSMKLAALSVENYKRITGAVVQFDVNDAGVVEIGGRNEQGKSSFLDALEVAIAGRKGPKASKPVHAGADRARIVASFEEEDGTKIVVHREFREDGTTSIVVKQDGLKVGKTTELLDRLWSHVAFDPFAWASLPSKEQVDTLVRVSGVDPAPFDKKYRETFEKRTSVNVEAKRLAGVLEGLPEKDEGLAARELVSVGALMEQIDALSKRNLERDDIRDNIRTDGFEVARQRNIIAEAEARIRDLTAHSETLASKLVELGDDEDPVPIRAEIASAQETNDAIRQQRERARIEEEHAELVDRAKNLTGLLEETAASKRQAFADADMPVPGLTIEDSEVYLDGTPFSQTSSGGKLRTSVAIAMALNPELRAIIIRDGSLLDSENRRIIDELAKANDFAVFMEVVDESAPSGIVFEDGKIRGAVQG